MEAFGFRNLSFMRSFHLFLRDFQVPNRTRVVREFVRGFDTRLCAFLNSRFRDSSMLFRITCSALVLGASVCSAGIGTGVSHRTFLGGALKTVSRQSEPARRALGRVCSRVTTTRIRLRSRIIRRPLPLKSHVVLPATVARPNQFATTLITRSYSS